MGREPSAEHDGRKMMEETFRMASGLGRELSQVDGVVFEPNNYTHQNRERHFEMGKKRKWKF